VSDRSQMTPDEPDE